MEKEELEKILGDMPAGTKITVQDDVWTWDVEAVGLKPKEVVLIVGNGNVLDLSSLAGMGVQFVGAQEIPEKDVAGFSLAPVDFITSVLNPLPEPTFVKNPFNKFSARAEKNLVKKISDKHYPKRTLGLIRGKGRKQRIP